MSSKLQNSWRWLPQNGVIIFIRLLTYCQNYKSHQDDFIHLTNVMNMMSFISLVNYINLMSFTNPVSFIKEKSSWMWFHQKGVIISSWLSDETISCRNILQRNFGLLYIFGQPFPNISLILGHYVRNLKKTHSTPKE